MGIDIFKRENWSRWEAGPYESADLRLDAEKDRELLRHILRHCTELQRRRLMIRHHIKEISAPPVNLDDESDADYAPYAVLREQVMREDDYWTLKAALEAPNAMMRRFAFCRLTGYRWPAAACDAYSYKTYDCGLKREVSREDIEDLCRELIDERSRFARRAAEWLERLPSFTDDELVEWAAGKTERRWDDDPDELLRKHLRKAEHASEEEDMEDKICAIFDAYIFRKYQRHHLYGSGVVLREAVEDELTKRIADRLEKMKSYYRDFETAFSEIMKVGERELDLAPSEVTRLAWSISPRSRQHSFFLWMAYWYGIDAEEDNNKALGMLADAAERGHVRSFDEIVHIYASGEYVRRDFRLALRWQEKKVECLRGACEAMDPRDFHYSSARERFARALRQTGDLLSEAGNAKRAKQYYRRAEEIEGA